MRQFLCRMLCNEYAYFYLPSGAEPQQLNGTIVIEKNFLEKERESFAVDQIMAKPTNLLDANIFPYPTYMIQVSENGPVGNNTGQKMVGQCHPFWREVCDLALDAHGKLKDVVIIGWDIAMTPDGPVIVEMNFPPG